MKTHRVLTSLVLALAVSAVTLASAASPEKGAEPLKISHGEEVDIAAYRVPGKTTVFDFTSQYCPPCQRISPHLDRLHANRDDVAVVKVDINRPDVRGIDWESPVARQYQLRSIPHFKVYGPDGELVAEGEDATAMVVGWFEE